MEYNGDNGVVVEEDMRKKVDGRTDDALCACELKQEARGLCAIDV
jgi:hypothetical protein